MNTEIDKEESLRTFQSFPKMSRLSRDIIITEKIDGTNAQVVVLPSGEVLAGSRNRWITPEADNYGFAAWVQHYAEDLRGLGIGRHFGEWWGNGIQRGYGQPQPDKTWGTEFRFRFFSLFNVSRWDRFVHEYLESRKPNTQEAPKIWTAPPACCQVVPTLYVGPFSLEVIEDQLNDLKEFGSAAAEGYRDPEGIVIFHTASGTLFKKTIEDDDKPKSV